MSTSVRLRKEYIKTVRPALCKELGFKNLLRAPRIEKIVINVGVKDAIRDSRVLQKVTSVVAALSGQAPVITKAKKSIAGFKLRQGMPIGVMVTLRRRTMYEFLDRLINLALPNVRDFRGLSAKFDKEGNYNLGLKEWIIFPEADEVSRDMIMGMNISIITSTRDAKETRLLLEKFNMPFKKEEQKKKAQG